jgi:hypothetical protein
LGFALIKFPLNLHNPLTRWFGSYSQNTDNFYQQDSHYPVEIVENLAILADVPMEITVFLQIGNGLKNQKV